MRHELLYLKDVIEAIERIERYLVSAGRETFFAETIWQDAIVRNLEIIGEATKQISEATRLRRPHVPWQAIARMRDRLAHHYFRVDLEIVWKTATQELPVLKAAVAELLKELEP